jgi:hypothetical protein
MLTLKVAAAMALSLILKEKPWSIIFSGQQAL